MTVSEIIAALTKYTGVLPREAIEEAVAQREAITPELLRILEESTENLAEIAEDEEYMAHEYAMFLLAQFREQRAYPLLVKFYTADQKLVDEVTGDITTEYLDRMLASVCHGDTSLIKQMIEDPTLDEYVRSAALGSLVILVTQGVKSRDEIMAYFKELFNRKLERKHDLIWSSMVSQSCDLYPAEVMPEIEQAFADGLIDTFFINKAFVNKVLTAGKEHTLAELQKEPHQRFIEDTVKELESWACFRTPTKPEVKPLPQAAWEPVSVQQRTAQKVGRNEPCPCGSGKKYKKCCLALQR